MPTHVMTTPATASMCYSETWSESTDEIASRADWHSSCSAMPNPSDPRWACFILRRADATDAPFRRDRTNQAPCADLRPAMARSLLDADIEEERKSRVFNPASHSY